jgi:putative ABC transport system permease protein
LIGYYFRLALRSLRRTPVMTALMIMAIGLGIGASMTMLTVLHVMTQDPFPERSNMLFTPHLDPLPKDYPSDSEWGDPADNMTWPDAMALLRAKWAPHQAAMAGAELMVWPVQGNALPVELSGRFTTAGFFPMFGLPLERGVDWSEADDERRARVAVLGHDLARKLFGNRDPIGQEVRFNDTPLRVVGVAADWAPQPLFYADASEKGGFGQHDDFFVPLSTSIDLHWQTSGHTSGWGSEQTSDDAMYKDPRTSWLQFWVQLDTPSQVAAYRRHLYDYAAQQHASGRFERGPDSAQLYPLMAWLRHQNLVPRDVRLQFWLAVGFLVVCLVNIVALLLAKFLRRGGELGVRRALGASGRDILLQLGSEALLIGLLGGALGVVLAKLGLWAVRQRPDAYARAAQMDTTMFVSTIVMAMLATLLAGMLPAWRASRIPPALQIKAV